MPQRRIWLFGLWVLLACVTPGLISPASGQGCGSKGDWKDIYILPTNPRPDCNINVTLSVDKTLVVPGDEIALTFQADRDCYLTIMNLGSSGRIVRLWPNDYSGMDNLVRANQPRRFPGPTDGFRYKIAGPDGVERIIAYATTDKAKVLTESEFHNLGASGFKQFVGGVKDLVLSFNNKAENWGNTVGWGTKQINVCIGRGTTESPGTPSTGTTYVLSVGVPTGELKYCAKDAQNFTDALTAKMGVRESNIRLVLGAEATYDGVVKGLQWLTTATQPEDTAVVYFSGHGASIPDQPPLDEPDGKDECFVLYHTSPPKDDVTAIREKILMVDDDFNILMKKVVARKKIVVVDACHSGTINKEFGLRYKKLVSKFYPLKNARTGEKMWSLKSKSEATNYGNDNEALLSACLDNQSSYEDQAREAGIFTYHLVAAIKSGAVDLETAFETAKRIVEQETAEYSRQSSGTTVVQTPNLTDPHGLIKLFRFIK